MWRVILTIHWSKNLEEHYSAILNTASNNGVQLIQDNTAIDYIEVVRECLDNHDNLNSDVSVTFQCPTNK